MRYEEQCYYLLWCRGYSSKPCDKITPFDIEFPRTGFNFACAAENLALFSAGRITPAHKERHLIYSEHVFMLVSLLTHGYSH